MEKRKQKPRFRTRGGTVKEREKEGGRVKKDRGKGEETGVNGYVIYSRITKRARHLYK